MPFGLLTASAPSVRGAFWRTRSVETMNDSPLLPMKHYQTAARGWRCQSVLQ
jgi:hypothetical protein